MKMKKIYIWGAGYYADHVYSVIDKNACTIEGIIDSDVSKQGSFWNGILKIYTPKDLIYLNFDCIIISALQYEEIERMCRKLGIPGNKVIAYWKDSESIGLYESRAMGILKERHEKEIFENRLDSAPYEWGLKPVPQIRSAEELLRKIIIDHSSLCRFGDGEFNIMCKKGEPWFQNSSESLRNRLIEVISSHISNINIAIAQNFSHLECYKEAAADEIRAYMSHGTRDEIITFLEEKSTYYDAYVSRPYIIYKNKENAERIFPLFQKIWEERDVILVEGKYARFGINNNLLGSAKSIKRIICPAKGAWDCYGKILESVQINASKRDLVCVSLGPAATVLAYDLAREGYQALDIGQLDNEYDWYLKGVDRRTAISGKLVAEVAENLNINECDSKEYRSQIVAEIN